jgi:DNA polymerase I
MLRGWLPTVYGWKVQVGAESNPRSLANFPAQANGAELLRLACCLATERGIEVCAPVHDAVLIAAPLDRLERDIGAVEDAMREASRIVLNGFELNTDKVVVRYPERYMDEGGKTMWDKVMALLDQLDAETVVGGTTLSVVLDTTPFQTHET